ncbi:MAG: glycosyltransferase family 2 protein [Pseudomonadota bacterium]
MINYKNSEKNDFITAVVIPCFKVKSSVMEVIKSVPAFIDKIYVVDDFCPENTGKYVESNCQDERIKILYNETNMGVGGAMITGYKQALADNCDIIAKLDGDGQMDGTLLPKFINPIIKGQADYTKGNRFHTIESLKDMPTGRIIGNAILSFVTKLSSGYWHVFDPTNGYTCISSEALKILPLNKISNGYFFESDMMFRLNTVRAVVIDIPMHGVYGEEKSNLSFRKNILPFVKGHTRNFFKRLVYNYFLRNFVLASLELVFGTILLLFGIVFGIFRWSDSLMTGHANTTGTIMIAVLPIITGFQLIMAFLNYDVSNQPTKPICQNDYKL